MPAVTGQIVGSFASTSTQGAIPIEVDNNSTVDISIPNAYTIFAFVAGASYAGAFAPPDPTWALLDPPQITAHGFTAACYTKVAGANEPTTYLFSQGGPGSTFGYVSGVIIALPPGSVDSHVVNAAFAPGGSLAATATSSAPTLGDIAIAVLALQNGSDSAGVGSTPNPAWAIDTTAVPRENALVLAHYPNTFADTTTTAGFACSTGANGGDFLGFLIFVSPGNAQGALVPGDILRNDANVVVTPKSVAINASPPSGGTPPYTYAWYRGTSASFTADNSNILIGQTDLSLLDSAVVAGQRYSYIFVYTDSAGQTVESVPQLVVIPLAVEYVGFIGDGTGYGVGTTVQSAAQSMGNAIGAGLALAGSPKTCGVLNSSVPESTTENWLPGGSYLTPAVKTFAANSVQYVVVALGLEDARDDVGTSALDYIANLRAICEYIATELPGAIIVVMFPHAIDVGRSEFPFSVASLDRLAAYFTAFPQTATGGITGLVLGDTNAWTYFGFSAFDQIGADGVHPNDIGAAALGALWAKAVLGVQTSSVKAPLVTTIIALSYVAA